MIAELIHSCCERSEELGQERRSCDMLKEWHRNRKRIEETPRLWLGGLSAFVPEPKKGQPHAGTKFVDDESWPVTPGEVARHWVREYGEKIGQKVKIVSRKYQSEIFHSLSAPYFFTPPKDRGGPWAIVDIDACYFSLYNPMYFDMEFSPFTQRCGLGRFPAGPSSDLKESKTIRNALFGNMLTARLGALSFGELPPPNKCAPNNLYAPGLASYVWLTCHAIAQEARESYGFISWSTDGGICRPETAERFISFLEDKWHLSASVRCIGPGYVWGHNSWSVGGMETKDVTDGRCTAHRALEQSKFVRPETVDWLANLRRERVSK